MGGWMPRSAWTSAWEAWNYGGRVGPEPRIEDYPGSEDAFRLQPIDPLKGPVNNGGLGYGQSPSDYWATGTPLGNPDPNARGNPNPPSAPGPTMSFQDAQLQAFRGQMTPQMAQQYAALPEGLRASVFSNWLNNGQSFGAPPSTTAPQQNSAAPSGGGQFSGPVTRESLMDYFRQYGQQNGGDPSAVNDPGYWADVALEKIGRGAGVQDTLGYLGGRITGGSGGGGGMSGGMGNYSPLAPFQFNNVNFQNYAAPSVSAPPGFKYTGPAPQAPTPFGFPGVYQPQRPQQPIAQPTQAAPQQPAAPSGPPPPPPEAGADPYGGQGVYIPSGTQLSTGPINRGMWLPASDPAAQEYAGQFPAPSAPQDASPLKGQGAPPSGPVTPESGGMMAIQTPWANGGMGDGGLMAEGDVPDFMRGPMRDPRGMGDANPGTPDQAGGWMRSSDRYGQPQGQGMGLDAAGVSLPPYQAPDAYQAPPPFSYRSLNDPATYQGAQTFSSTPVPEIGPYNAAQTFSSTPLGPQTPYQQAQTFQAGQTPQIDRYQAPQSFTYQGVPNVGTFDRSGQINASAPFSYAELGNIEGYTPGQFKAPTLEEAQNDPGYQFRLKQGMDALQQSAAARGTLFDTGTLRSLQDYGQEAASQEYQNVYGRRANEFAQSEAGRAQSALYNRDTALASQAQRFNQGLSAYDLNERNRQGAEQQSFGNELARFQTNAQTQLGQQAQGFGQARDTASLNESQRLNAYTADASTALGANQQQYGQNLGAAQFNEGNRFNAAQFNTNTNLAQNAQDFGQGLAAAQFNEGNRFNAANFNATNALAQNQQQFGQNLSGAQFNEANRLNAFNANTAANQAYQGQQFNQAAQAYGMNADAAFRANQTNQENTRANYALNAQTQLGAQNQAFGQSLGAWQANNAANQAYQQAAWQQQYQPWAQGASNYLSAAQGNQSAALSTNALNSQAEQNAAQMNNQNAWNAYQSQVQQNQFGAGMGLNWAQYGLGAQNQAFNQNLATYNTNQNTVWGNRDRDFNENFSLANLGANAAAGLGGLGQGYAGNIGNLYAGIGNAQAAGQIGAGNAYANLYGNLANLGMSGLGYYYGHQGTQQSGNNRFLNGA